jgi:hypothetical protein
MMTPPIARSIAPMNQQTREPQRSRIVPTGRAETFAVIDAIVKNRFSLRMLADENCIKVQMGISIPEILLGTEFYSFCDLIARASLVINAFFNEDGFERGEAEDDSRRAPTRENSHYHLNWRVVSDAFIIFILGRFRTYSFCGGVFIGWCSRTQFCDRHALVWWL